MLKKEKTWYYINSTCNNNSNFNNIGHYSNFNTSKVEYMNNMFCECNSLSSIDISNFDTCNVIDMSCMFCDCISLPSIDISNLDTSNVRYMDFMFGGYYYDMGLTKIVDLNSKKFDTSNVKSMRSMFEYCVSMEGIDVSGFDTSYVTDMTGMFYNFSSLTEIKVGTGWTTKHNPITDGMYTNCPVRPSI